LKRSSSEGGVLGTCNNLFVKWALAENRSVMHFCSDRETNMAKVAGFCLMLLFFLVGYPLTSLGSESYQAARRLALAAPNVVGSAGADASVIYNLPSSSSARGNGEACASYRLLVRGSKGIQWLGIQIYREAKEHPWRTVHLLVGTGGAFNRCPLR
jgi:hypothetical protein